MIKIDIPNLKALKDGFNKSPAVMTKNINVAVRSTIFFIRGKAVAGAPARTGNLRGSAYTSFAPLMGEIGFKAKYAAWVHEGTSPYIIEPSGKKALFWKGASHPVKRVHHPGIRANPFLRRAVDQSQPATDRFFHKAVQDTLDTIAKGAPES